MRYRTLSSRSPGSRWMSEARSWIAWVMRALTYLTMGASSTTSRTLERSSSSSRGVEDGRQVVELAVGAVVAVDRREHVCLGGDDGADLGLAPSPDIVDGKHVGGVGHRQQQTALLESDGQHRVLPAHSSRHQGDGGGVDRVVRQLDEAHADLLGESGHELRLAEDALVDEHTAECATGALLLLVRVASWS